MGVTAALAVLAAAQVGLAPTPAAVPGPSQVAAEPPQLLGTPWTLRIGPQRPDLVRYNRVEALSLGVRAQVRPATSVGPVSLTGTVRFGAADRHLNGRLDMAHETLDRRIVVSGYHELAAIDERARHFGVANSLTALLLGRDDGDYYRRSGAAVAWGPPIGSTSPALVRYRAWAEYHEAADQETDFQLPEVWDDSATFRPNLSAEEGWEYGVSMEFAVRFGTDPDRTRGGIEYLLAGSWGGLGHVRFSSGADVTFALPAELRLTLEGAAGLAEGAPPQRLSYLGGPITLRGYAPRAAGGEGFGRGRVELDRAFSFGRIVLFSDVGWTGDWPEARVDESLYSAGAGLAIIDGILRVDGGWRLEGPHDFRLDIYLDQIP